MNNYRLNFYITGVEDESLEQISLKEISIFRKGEICNKRTGKKYTENIFKKTIFTTYEEGFGPALNQMIEFIKSNPCILELKTEFSGVSFQVCVDLDDECNIPYINFTPKQLSYLAEIDAELEFHIS